MHSLQQQQQQSHAYTACRCANKDNSAPHRCCFIVYASWKPSAHAAYQAAVAPGHGQRQAISSSTRLEGCRTHMPHPSHPVLQNVQVQHTQPLLAVSADSKTVAILTAQVGSLPAAGWLCNLVQESQHTRPCARLCAVQGTPWAHAKGGIKNVRGTPAVCLAWAPDMQLLAIAWQDGAVSLWDEATCHLEEDSKTHREPVSQLLWHPGGRHFMTADTSGKVSGAQAGGAGQHLCAAHAVVTACTVSLHCR